jgi:hypothetical protein
VIFSAQRASMFVAACMACFLDGSRMLFENLGFCERLLEQRIMYGQTSGS